MHIYNNTICTTKVQQIQKNVKKTKKTSLKEFFRLGFFSYPIFSVSFASEKAAHGYEFIY